VSGRSYGRWLYVKKRRREAMPKMSRESAPEINDKGPADDRRGDLDGYTFNFVTLRQDSDLAPLLKGLPDDLCHCPHWGYMFKGKLTVRYKDR